MSGFQLFLILLTIFALVVIVATVRFNAQLKALTIERQSRGLGVDSFIREFNEDIDRDLLIAVYKSASRIMGSDTNEFIVMASDTIAGTYEFIDELGKQEFVELVLKDTGRSTAHYLSDPLYPELESIRDLVSLVANQPTT